MPKEKSKKARNELSLKQKNQILEEYERSNGSLGVRRSSTSQALLWVFHAPITRRVTPSPK